MAALLAWLVRQIGVTGCAVLLLLGYYEGVPGLRDIPFIERVPFAREFIVGRVSIEAAKASADATRRMVARSELKTALAKAAALEEQIRTNKRMAEAALKEAERARLDAETANKELEATIAQDLDDDGCTWTDRDLDWLRNR
ncbi:hypothetical protein QN224_13330 [Sinorhizobium sp. 8-89]|uniref:hypothetical protein n=1 Tax=Sinorhizobium sp. 7-81 TaxID=3049087 RepID=UPI0024C46750|nr:hypothetical protein [Sinorhizobium sp. 7-81]MDK1386392.1 hypothetical protein [Sinorhizobium sp. 7-81]